MTDFKGCHRKSVMSLQWIEIFLAESCYSKRQFWDSSEVAEILGNHIHLALPTRVNTTRAPAPVFSWRRFLAVPSPTHLYDKILAYDRGQSKGVSKALSSRSVTSVLSERLKEVVINRVLSRRTNTVKAFRLLPSSECYAVV